MATSYANTGNNYKLYLILLALISVFDFFIKCMMLKVLITKCNFKIMIYLPWL